MGGEKAAVGGGEAEEMADAVVDGGLDGNQAGGEVGMLAHQETETEQGFEKVWHRFAVLRLGLSLQIVGRVA